MMYVPRTAMSVILIVNDQVSKISRLCNYPDFFFFPTLTPKRRRDLYGVTKKAME